MAAISLSKQQWRTYRNALPPLNLETGRSACFNAGDLLAVAVVQAGSDALQSPISTFAPVATALFELCRSASWPRLERAHLVLVPSQGRALLVDPEQKIPAHSMAIVIELAPMVVHLRERLMAAGSNLQHDFTFPPMVAGGRP